MSGKIKLERILVLDDDESTNYLTGLYFKRSKILCDVSFLTNVDDALEFLKSNKDSLPNLFFIDINLPALSGWDLLDILKKQNFFENKEVVIFILSTSIYDKDKDKAKTYPEITAYIEKPLTVEKIIEIKEKYFL